MRKLTQTSERYLIFKLRRSFIKPKGNIVNPPPFYREWIPTLKKVGAWPRIKSNPTRFSNSPVNCFQIKR